MSLPPLLSRWRSDPDVAANIVEWRTIPARVAQFSPFPEDLSPILVETLHRQGIHSLYSHQATAWQLTQDGQNIVVVTGTSSGKTLCYNLPVLDCLSHQPEARALFLFPTKALAQDQLAGIKDLVTGFEEHGTKIPEAIYDGDTPARNRPSIRSNARLVISNPDMLHTGILPHHTSWAEFFRNLRYVVIDEMHTYRGVFGSHVANVIRRLKRVAHFYGSNPQFILTSATIANPVELAEWLIEEPVNLVNNDGSARGPKHFLIYNPPVVNRQLGIRRSVLQESVRLAEDLMTYAVQTIIFGRTRRTVELILTYLRQASIPSSSNQRPGQEDELVRGYRSGYLAHTRREIEHGLKAGDIRVVVATNALELGIDIGGMGAALLVGYPGSIAATWQQAGRSGRQSEASLAILVASVDPLDQFLVQHPDYFFGRTPEQALINPDNLLILLQHIRCAAFEIPFHKTESFGKVESSKLLDFLEFLRNEGSLHLSRDQFFWMADQYPAQTVSLRSTTVDSVALHTLQDESWRVIGQVDTPSAHWMVHPGAIYMQEAQTYVVEELDLENHIARLISQEVDYYTEPRLETIVQLIEQTSQEVIHGGTKTHGDISVTTQLIGFRKIKWYTHEILGSGDVTLPPVELQTTGYWLGLSESTIEALREDGVWTGSPIDYGREWPGIRRQVRERDGYRCQVCGASETIREHDVHHIVPFRTFTQPELANHLTNLITLCPVCHRRAETAVHIRSGLAGLSFALGHLAPLFLMCDSGDLGIHSDPQSPLTDGQPTVIIYDQVPAGIGFSQRLYELHDEIMQHAYDLVTACQCSDGCPSCVGPGSESGVGGKQEALAILAALIH